MDAYRDQYAQLFGSPDKVTLVSVSIDPDTTQASWAKEKDYHWTFASDTGAGVGQKYGSVRRRQDGTLIDNRTLFIVGPDGKIAHLMAPFREADATAYTDRKSVV